MPKDLSKLERDVQVTDRRGNARVGVRSLAYVDLDRDNGGLILNIGEGGMAVQSAEMVVGDRFPRMRFRLPKSEKWIEASGKLAWKAKSRKELGIEFLQLNQEARGLIRDWIYSATFSPDVAAEPGHFKIVWESQEHSDSAVDVPQEAGKSEFDAMFPSEKSLSPETFPGLNRPAHREPAGPPVEESALMEAKGSSSFSPRSYDLPLVRPRGTKGQGEEDIRVRRERIDSSPAQIENPPVEAGRPRTARPEGNEGLEVHKLRAAFEASNPRQPKHAPPSGDPFESVVAAEQSSTMASAQRDSHRLSGGSNHTPVLGKAVSEQTAAAPEIAFTGFGYQPTRFEEPSGRGWLMVAAVLVALLAFGGALAIGPRNVKVLFSKVFNSHSESTSTQGPPPPANASTGTQSAEAASGAKDTARAVDPMPSDNDAQRAILNPGVTPDETSRPTSDETKNASLPASSGIGGDKAVAGKSAAESAPENPGSAIADPEETREAAEATTRQFQMEHSQSRVTSSVSPPTIYDGASVPPSATAPVMQSPTTGRQSDSGAPAQPAPLNPASSSDNVSSGSGNQRLAVPALPAGTVAINSHFHSLRGEESLGAPIEGALQVGQLLAMQQPAYPIEAARMRVEGTVRLQATVDVTGRVEIVHVLSGPPILVPYAVDAVKLWRYAPTVLNGRAVESVNDITVAYRLANAAPSPR